LHRFARRRRLGQWSAVLLGVLACAPGARWQPSAVPQTVATKAPASAARASAPAVSRRGGAAKPVVRVDSTALEFAVTARHAHGPLSRALASRTRNDAVAERAAWALTREAARLRLSPSLLAAVLLVENRALDSSAVSSQGAIGLMQVMPIHAGSYGCGSADLRTVDANICHGARILHTYIRRTGSVPLALRRYNGCVKGRNTPGCSRYPLRVLRTAGRLRREMLATPARSVAPAGLSRLALAGSRRDAPTVGRRSD
jgi:soluble lytic murein transglycosylase-like protein